MIQINLDIVMAQKRISAGRLAELIDLTPANLSILKNNKAKASGNVAEKVYIHSIDGYVFSEFTK